MRVQRFDRLEVKLDRDTVKVQADGSRIVDGVGAHVGPYVYHDDQGREFIEYVPASALFDPVSLASAAGASVTIRHGPGLVTADAYRTENHGSWVRAWDAGGGLMGVTLRLYSREVQDFMDTQIDAGEPIELSPVYTVEVLDEPGTSEHGPHHAVQDERLYSGIAVLGADEARGGPEMRLHADGPECAPAGSRVQVRRPRLDSGPRAVQHSETGRSNMKHATISSEGRRRRVSADTLAHIRTASKLHSDATNADQIAVGRVLVEIEGEEPVDLVLPTSMIEMLLEGIGAGPVAAAPVEPLEEEVALEALDADDGDAKLDARVRKIAGDMMDRRARKTAQDSARSTSVNADAATILPPGYDYSVHWTQVALDAIAKGYPDDVPSAQNLIARVMKGDSVAEGMLRQMLADRRAAPAGGLQLVKATNTDSNETPWASSTMPKSEVKQ